MGALFSSEGEETVDGMPKPKPMSPEDAAILALKTELKTRIKEMQREIDIMEYDDKINLRNIKQLFEDKKDTEAKNLARSLVNERQARFRLQNVKGRFARFSSQLTIMRGNIGIAKFSSQLAKIMHSMNEVMQPEAIKKLVDNLVSEAKTQATASDAISSALDAAFSEMDKIDGVDKASNPELSESMIMNAICDEIGLRDSDLFPTLGPLPTAKQSDRTAAHGETTRRTPVTEAENSASAPDISPTSSAPPLTLPTLEADDFDTDDRELLKRFQKLSVHK